MCSSMKQVERPSKAPISRMRWGRGITRGNRCFQAGIDRLNQSAVKAGVEAPSVWETPDMRETACRIRDA